MPDDPSQTTEIKDTDIVFDCPQCGKSLAIDYRGAGLTIPCSDCGKTIEVPIPDGMELTDIDSSDEEQEMQILNLRRSLSAAEYRITQLERELEELGIRRELLERERTTDLGRKSKMSEQLLRLSTAVRATSEVVEEMMGDAQVNPE